MTYTVTDITELIRYHLVLSEETDERADANLAQLVGNIETMASAAPVSRACYACRVWVTADQVGPDGAGEAGNGEFYCRACRLMETAVAEATWVFCDRCGTSVDTVLIHPDGHHYSDDGDFYCADCWGADDEEPATEDSQPRAIPTPRAPAVACPSQIGSVFAAGRRGDDAAACFVWCICII